MKRLFVLTLAMILVYGLSFGCNSENKANAKGPGENKITNIDLLELLDTESLWYSSRQLADAVVKMSDKYVDLQGAQAFFRFAYTVGIEGGLEATNKISNAHHWPAPVELNEYPLAAVCSIEDMYALYGMPEIDRDDVAELYLMYNMLSAETVAGINNMLAASDDGSALYAIDASGFYSEVDHHASISAFIIAYDIAADSLLSPSDILMDRYENMWDEVPEGADGEADLIGLMEIYDIVTYPYTLDILYRETGDSEVYFAMAEILSIYRDALDVGKLVERIDTVSNKEQTLGQLCILARLFRRMYAFLDEDEYFEKAEEMLAKIGPMCLAGADKLALNYIYTLLLFEEPAVHVVIIGPSDNPNYDKFAKMSRERFEPRLALMPIDPERDAELLEIIEYPPKKEPACFVCIDANCFPPVSTVKKVAEVFDKVYEEITENRDKKLKKLLDEEE